MRIAAIDIGTVTCRLLIADCSADGMHELYRRSEITNLGEGVDACGALQPGAIDRVCSQVEEYLEAIQRFSSPENPIVVRTMATSASRDASNCNEFSSRLAELGIDLSVIPGQREAELSFLGASAGFTGQRLLVSDIGGGSTELIAGIAGQGIVHAHSYNIGCRRATERLLHSDPPTLQERTALAEWVQSEFSSFFAKLDELQFVPQRYVAVAGTSTSVVSIHQNMEVYDRAAVQGTVVDAATLDEVAQRLYALPLGQRKQVVGLQPNRASIMVAGLVILQQVLALSGLPSYTAGESDILEGIVLDAAMA